MKRTKLTVACIICILLLALSAFAEKINLPSFDVTLNGTKIDSASRQYPLIVYKDITYFPMTYFDCRFLGVSTEWSSEDNTLSIYRESISSAYRDYKSDSVNTNFDEASICSFNVFVNGLEIFNENEEYPLLLYRDVTYFPLTWRFAVDEFGWEYSFDAEKGLVINSEGANPQSLDLPDFGGAYTAATDGKYYYYSGNNNNIFRTPVSDTSKYELIHTMPHNSGYADITYVEFESSDNNVFFRYHIGGATMGTTYRYKVNADGSCERSDEGTYRSSGIGYNKYTIDGDGYKVEIYNSGHIGTTEIFYTKDETALQIQVKLEGVRFGEYRDLSMKLDDGVENGEWLGSNKEGNIWFGTPVLLGKALYSTGWNENEEKNSSLYRIDLVSGEIKEVAENVGIFHAFFGWDNEVSGMSEMAIFDRDGIRYRYSSVTGKIIPIDENVLPMTNACGDFDLKVVGSDGEFTQVYVYDSYGIGSISEVIFETFDSFEFVTKGNLLYGICYSAAEGIPFIALSSYHNFTKFSELPNYAFIHDNTLMLCLDDPAPFVVRMEL